MVLFNATVNRTNVELKLNSYDAFLKSKLTVNRTNVELKYARSGQH